jgi:CDP-Glycerol:Poly(glycerophosphate) glycerophosphotransferase
MTRLTRLTSSLRSPEVVVSATWILSAGLAVVAALREWGWVLALALVVNYVADATFYAVDERVATWFHDRQLAPVHRHLFREGVAVLGWVLIAAPSQWEVLAAVLGVLAVHATHSAYRVLGARNRRRRRGRVTWRNLDVAGRSDGPEILPPTLPRTWTIGGPRWALHVDVALVAGLALSWLLESAWPLWAGLALVAVGACFVTARVLARRRLVARLPQPADERAAVLESLEDYAPEVVVYFSGGPGTTYQLNVWLETIDRIERRTLIVVRELLHLDALLPTRTPVLVLPRAQDVEAFQVASMKVALYPTTVIKNNHMIRLRGLRHVFINHGDGDKAVTYSPLHRVFDEIWVAGQAACDRYLERGEGVRPDQLITVGRPQLAHIHSASTTPRDPGAPVTVLYAPTWEGNFEGVNYSSVAPMGVRMVEQLLASDRDIRVLFKAHPATGTRVEAAGRARARIEELLRGDDRHRVVGTEPDALYRAFNDADVLLADISSVVADFLASRKPYIVTNPADVPLDEFVAQFPSTSAGGVVGRDAATLLDLVEDAAGPDTLRGRRHELATYFLGEPLADPVQRFVDEVDAACRRSEASLERSAALAQAALVGAPHAALEDALGEPPERGHGDRDHRHDTADAESPEEDDA